MHLTDISIDQSQPHKDFGDLEGLKASIREHGVISPIILSLGKEGSYQIIAGERRFRASKELRLDAIPAIIRTVQEQQRLELQIIENLHRKDLNPIEEARSYRRLIVEFNLTQEQVAERIGKSKSSINEILRLLDFPDDLVAALGRNDSIPKSVLLKIARNDDRETRMALLHRAQSGHLTVREARNAKANTARKQRN